MAKKRYSTEQYLQELGEKEVSAVKVGEKVISKIYNLDDVAYVRFILGKLISRPSQPVRYLFRPIGILF